MLPTDLNACANAIYKPMPQVFLWTFRSSYMAAFDIDKLASQVSLASRLPILLEQWFDAMQPMQSPGVEIDLKYLANLPPESWKSKLPFVGEALDKGTGRRGMLVFDGNHRLYQAYCAGVKRVDALCFPRRVIDACIVQEGVAVKEGHSHKS